MPVTYPIDHPTLTHLADVDVELFDNVGKPTSPTTLQSNPQHFGGQEWRFTVTLPRFDAATSALWESFLAKLRGRQGTFLFGDPGRGKPRGTATAGTVTGTKDSDQVALSLNGTLLEGDVFQVGTGANARMYKVCEDVDGTGTIPVWPDLRASVTAGALVLTKPKTVCELMSNARGWGYSGSGRRRMVIAMKEAFRLS